MRDPINWIPDVRDGLSRVQRIVLYELYKAQREMPNRENIPSTMLYGRVVEHVNLDVDEFQAVLQTLGVASHMPGRVTLPGEKLE